MADLLELSHPDLNGLNRATLTAEHSAGATQLNVDDATGYAGGQYVVVGAYNQPKTEIVLVSGVPSATALTVSALQYDHAPGAGVTFIPYNQIALETSTDLATLWESGVYATLVEAASAATWVAEATVSITPSSAFTSYNDTTPGDFSYRYRYYHAANVIYSGYDSPILPSGFDNHSVQNIIDTALDPTNKVVSQQSNGEITFDFCLRSINMCSDAVHVQRRRWHHDQYFNRPIRSIVAGTNSYRMPTNIDTNLTNLSTWNLKINDDVNLSYVDKRTMDGFHRNAHYAPLAAQLTSASTTATFNSTYGTGNFPDSGTFSLFVNGVRMTITFTANNRTTNVLTTPNCATEVTATAAVGTPAWVNETFGIPTYFTVYGGYISFDVVPNEQIHGRYLQADYYLKVQRVSSFNDYVVTSDPNIYIHFLRRDVNYKSGNRAEYVIDNNEFKEAMKALKRRESTGQKQYIKPKPTIFGLPTSNPRRYYRRNIDDQVN